MPELTVLVDKANGRAEYKTGLAGNKSKSSIHHSYTPHRYSICGLNENGGLSESGANDGLPA